MIFLPGVVSIRLAGADSSAMFFREPDETESVGSASSATLLAALVMRLALRIMRLKRLRRLLYRKPQMFRQL